MTRPYPEAWEARKSAADVLRLDCRVDVYTIGRQNPVVVVTHIPTGKRAECSTYASQLMNRVAAMTTLAEMLSDRQSTGYPDGTS
jgi:protein subunit release factor A